MKHSNLKALAAQGALLLGGGALLLIAGAAWSALAFAAGGAALLWLAQRGDGIDFTPVMSMVRLPDAAAGGTTMNV